jgi:hypothetical protein
MLEGNFVFLIYNMFVFMERHWRTLLEDVRNGTITEEFPIPAEFREKLRPFHPTMPARATVWPHSFTSQLSLIFFIILSRCDSSSRIYDETNATGGGGIVVRTCLGIGERI